MLESRAIALDDQVFLVHNPLVLRPGVESARRFFTEVLAPSSVSAYYLPLSMTSLMLDVAAGGSPSNLRPFHVTSLALHVAGAVLLFLLLDALLGAPLPAALAALAYGVHPMIVEAIASVGERKTVLATTFAFATLWAHARHAAAGGWAWRAASILCFALALLSKPSVIGLPLALIVLDVWPLRRLSWRTLLETWPHLSLALAFSAISVIAVQRTWEFGDLPPLEPVPLMLQALWLPGFYLARVVVPINLSIVNARPDPVTLANPVILSGIGLTLGVVLAAGWMRRRLPALPAGVAIFLVLLAPTFGILRFNALIAYDRYVHLPACGLALALGGLFASAWSKGRAARALLAVAALVLVAAEVVVTRRTIGWWRDSLTIWQRAVQLAPGVPEAHNGLGATFSEVGDHEAAARAFRRAIDVGPNYSDAYQNLGRELGLLGRYEEAVPYLATAAQRSPGSVSAALLLGRALELAGRPADAITQFRRALALRPGNASALRALGLGLVNLGRTEEGLDTLRSALEADPADANSCLALALALRDVGGADVEVVRLLHEALARDPGATAAMNELAWLRATSADPSLRDAGEALVWSERALASSPRPAANMLDTRAAALAASGRFAEAIHEGERAVRLATESRDDSLAREARRRLDGYRVGRAFVEPRTAPR